MGTDTEGTAGTCTGACPCDEVCPVGKALAVVGGKWKMRIICSLYLDGTMRYVDLVKKTKGITSAMLSSSLKDLEADGVIIRKQFEEIPPRVEYSLTDRGRELWPILHRLIHWARNEEFDGDGDMIYGRTGI
ncbi:MAG: helix-turn-helix transcriptional regulator [Firmicutes bacterium]|nr:helix-turn-helix transcriptional regulator [Bacillota bacterium]MBQ6261875.1 helix-turn-helix transcriptional regulator [Bacillota bacterium]MBR0114871.1 helix-turn-helix transcriptional regulator [Bacillota bacterium]